MKSITLFILLVFASTFTFAQESETVKKPATAISSKSEPATGLKKAEKAPTQQTVDTPAKAKDPYLERGEKIKSITKSGEIPASFPKFEDGMSAEGYKQIVFQWLRDNKDLIKEEAYEKLEPKLNK